MESYESHDAATEAAEAARRVTGTRTVGAALHDYLQYLGERERPLAKSSIETARHRLTAMLGLRDGDRRLCTLTADFARRLHASRAREITADSEHGELVCAVQWGAWCVEHGWLPANPFAGLRVTRSRSQGKPQLRVDEARRMLATVAADSSPEATAVLMALQLGLRAHEIVGRIARDLDDEGRVVWITRSKTRAGVRQLRVPEDLRARLLALAAGKRPDEPIFAGMTRYALHYHVVRFAKLAGVPRITPHGLRGTFSTLAVLAGVPVVETAKLLGHADAGSTARRHYMAPGAEESAASERVETMLGAPTTNPTPSPSGETLN